MSTIIKSYDKRRLDIVSEIADMVAVTAGPFGHNVDYHGGPHPMMFRDGLRVLEKYSPNGDLAHGIKMRMEEAAQRTVREAGDGSTTTTILLRWIFNYAATEIAMNAERDPSKQMPLSRRGIASGIRAAGVNALAFINGLSRRLDLDNPEDHDLLRKIAALAGSNSYEVGRVIADLIIGIGVDGYVIPEFDPRATSIQYTFRPGYRMPFGVIHPTMLPRGRNSITVHDAYVAVIKEHINTIDNLRPIIGAWKKYCEKNNRVAPLVLITAGIDADAMATIIHRTIDLNHKDHADPIWQSLPGGRAPWYCVRVSAMPDTWDDIEAITGARAFSSREGRGLKYFVADSGITMPSVVLGMNECVLSIDQVALAESGLVSRLKSYMETDEANTAISETASRVARLEGRVGIVKIPANSSAERAWTAEVFEDAYLAALSAVKEGFCPGAGKSLLLAARNTHEWAKQNTDSLTESQMLGLEAVGNAFECVIKTLLSNGGVTMERQQQIIDAMYNVDDEEGTTDWDTISLADDNLLAINSEIDASELMVPATESGVLDSAAALKAAIVSACAEAALWVETSVGVVSGVDKG